MSVDEVCRLLAAGVWSAVEYAQQREIPLEEMVLIIQRTPVELSQLHRGERLVCELGLRTPPEVINDE